VKLVGVGELHAAFLNESRTRGRVQCSVQEIRVNALGKGTATAEILLGMVDSCRRLNVGIAK